MCHLLSLLHPLERKAVSLLLSTQRISVETSNIIPEFAGSTPWLKSPCSGSASLSLLGLSEGWKRDHDMRIAFPLDTSQLSLILVCDY